MDGGSAAPGARGAAPTRPARPRVCGDGRRRRAGAPHGRLPGRRAADRDSGRPLHLGRARGAGLPRRRFPARSRSRASEPLGRLGARDEDERGRVPARVGFPALPGAQGADRRGVLQRERPGPVFPRPARPARRRGPPALRAARRRGAAVRARPVLRPLQGRRREPEHPAHPCRPGGRRGAARVGAARGARLRGGAPQPR